jgi:SAM-dependent methyltransferase
MAVPPANQRLPGTGRHWSAGRGQYEDFWADAPDDPEPWAWRRRRALLLAEARPGERVLDLGCGAGRFVAALQVAGARPVGVELAQAALDRARRNAPGADLRLLGDDGSLPLDHASVDLVWCSEVLEHVADTAHALLEVRRVLRPGGRLLVTVPFHGRVKGTLIALARFDAHFDPLGQHLRFYTRTSLAATLDETGFSEVRVRPWGGPPLLRTGLTAWASRP